MTKRHEGCRYFAGVTIMRIFPLLSGSQIKYKIIFSLVFTLLLFRANATSLSTPIYSKNVLSLGYGLYSYDFDNWGGTKGPLMAKYEHRFKNHLGLGVNVAAGRKMSDLLDGKMQQTTFFSALIRANYYLEINSELESYVGAGVGIRNTLPFHKPKNDPFDSKKNGIAMPDNSLGLEATIGLRYHATTKLSFYTEAGFSKGLIQFGACYHW